MSRALLLAMAALCGALPAVGVAQDASPSPAPEHRHAHPAPAPTKSDAAPAASTVPAPGPLPPPTPEARAAAFPDLGAMRMGDHMIEDPWVTSLRFDRLERAIGDGPDASAWDLRAWSGHDANRLWLRSEGERRDGATHGDVEAAWWHPVSPWWNGLVGLRHDLGGGRARDWAAFGAEGLAPYRIEVLGMVYVGQDGRYGARVEAEHEFLLTQRWVLQPRLEAEAYGGGEGPEDRITAGLRLRYEVRRDFAPYVGLEHGRRLGGGELGEPREDTRLVVGLRLGL